MVRQAVGIRSLAVSFPSVIRTQESWSHAFPGLATKARARVRSSKGCQVTRDQGYGHQARHDSDLDIWSQEVEPYLVDPFRGNVERRVLSPDESPRALERCVAEDALAAARLRPAQVELAIASALFSAPIGIGNAPDLARQLGLHCPAWNLESTCSSALIALQTACLLVQAGEYRNVLVVVSHFGSRAVDAADTLSWSMGDGVGAFVVSSLPAHQGILGTHVISTTGTCGAYIHELVADGQSAPRILTRTGENVSAIAETAVECVRTCCRGAAAKAGVNFDQIDFFAFNTPAAWYASVCVRALGIDPERAINLYPRYANIGAVLAIANLYHAAAAGKLREDDLVLVYTHGAGATAAATVMRWGEVALGAEPAPPMSVTPAQEKVRLASPPLNPPSFRGAEENCATVEPISRAKLLAAEPEQRRRILEAYLLEWLARSLPEALSSVSAEQPLASLLDSLMALTFKSHIEVNLQVRTPMDHFFGENTIIHLTEHILNQLELMKLNVWESSADLDTQVEEREKLSL